MADILFKTDDYIFSYRVGGLLIHNGKVLMQKAVAVVARKNTLREIASPVIA